MIKPKLLDQVRHAVRVRHLSLRTEQAYVHWIKRFILFHNKRHPNEMDESHVSQFLTYLAVRKRSCSIWMELAGSWRIFCMEPALD